MNAKTEKLRSMVSNNKIFVYGAGNQGRGIVRSLNTQGFQPVGFIDGNPDIQNRAVSDLPVYPPEYIMDQNGTKGFFIIVAAFFFEREISEKLESWGFIRGENYILYTDLKPYDYVVEVSGTCNLHCLSCPRGNVHSIKRPFEMMSYSTFCQILAKIRLEEPFVGNIQLYQWGEPTLNPELPMMIRHAREHGFICGLSSNLNHKADFKSIIEARPECLRISASGIGDMYGVTHTGGRWESFLTNIHTISRLRQKIYPEMKIELYYHRYKHSIGKAQEYITKLSKRLDFEFHPVPAYLISLDDVLAYCEGTPLPPQAQRAREMLLIDLDEGLEYAKKEASLKCDAMRVLMINADLSVSSCMMYYYPSGNTISENYLQTPLEEIVARRNKTALCARCKKYGIHRYCSVYARISEEERY